MKKFFFAALVAVAFNPLYAMGQQFTSTEKSVILAGDTATMLNVIQITVPAELSILTSVSKDINPGDKLLPVLARRMYLAMRDVRRPGIGIAAPQVGINRNIIWVKRYDKAGEPFELYINPKITWRSELLRRGMEGCLSIPDLSGNVVRNYTIKLNYQDQYGKHKEELIEGFTAVIFQHETDHLNGILFTDRLKEQHDKVYPTMNDKVNLLQERLLSRP